MGDGPCRRECTAVMPHSPVGRETATRVLGAVCLAAHRTLSRAHRGGDRRVIVDGAISTRAGAVRTARGRPDQRRSFAERNVAHLSLQAR
jgi:hypothetical protein